MAQDKGPIQQEELPHDVILIILRKLPDQDLIELKIGNKKFAQLLLQCLSERDLDPPPHSSIRGYLRSNLRKTQVFNSALFKSNRKDSIGQYLSKFINTSETVDQSKALPQFLSVRDRMIFRLLSRGGEYSSSFWLDELALLLGSSSQIDIQKLIPWRKEGLILPDDNYCELATLFSRELSCKTLVEVIELYIFQWYLPSPLSFRKILPFIVHKIPEKKVFHFLKSYLDLNINTFRNLEPELRWILWFIITNFNFKKAYDFFEKNVDQPLLKNNYYADVYENNLRWICVDIFLDRLCDQEALSFLRQTILANTTRHNPQWREEKILHCLFIAFPTLDFSDILPFLKKNNLTVNLNGFCLKNFDYICKQISYFPQLEDMDFLQGNILPLLDDSQFLVFVCAWFKSALDKNVNILPEFRAAVLKLSLNNAFFDAQYAKMRRMCGLTLFEKSANLAVLARLENLRSIPLLFYHDRACFRRLIVGELPNNQEISAILDFCEYISGFDEAVQYQYLHVVWYKHELLREEVDRDILKKYIIALFCQCFDNAKPSDFKNRMLDFLQKQDGYFSDSILHNLKAISWLKNPMEFAWYCLTRTVENLGEEDHSVYLGFLKGYPYELGRSIFLRDPYNNKDKFIVPFLYMLFKKLTPLEMINFFKSNVQVFFENRKKYSMWNDWDFFKWYLMDFLALIECAWVFLVSCKKCEKTHGNEFSNIETNIRDILIEMAPYYLAYPGNIKLSFITEYIDVIGSKEKFEFAMKWIALKKYNSFDISRVKILFNLLAEEQESAFTEEQLEAMDARIIQRVDARNESKVLFINDLIDWLQFLQLPRSYMPGDEKMAEKLVLNIVRGAKILHNSVDSWIGSHTACIQWNKHSILKLELPKNAALIVNTFGKNKTLGQEQSKSIKYSKLFEQFRGIAMPIKDEPGRNPAASQFYKIIKEIKPLPVEHESKASATAAPHELK